ncbi:MAG: cupin domain-containing protein [Acidobacteria bacterium]|nr:cupin domain-containing protein [Acidobacteriota bacterium]MBI3426951.1 cupin domain-containing protein [Acidobacteriota bacterium]
MLASVIFALGTGFGWLAAQRPVTQVNAQQPAPQAAPPAVGGYVHERDADVKKEGPAPHNGPGRSTGYSFFEKAPGFAQAFRKRVLHPGAAIGYHPQKEDEVYYILSGTGVMQMNGQEFPVAAGDAILTRPGSSHGLKQTGKDDLTLIITYEQKPR